MHDTPKVPELALPHPRTVEPSGMPGRGVRRRAAGRLRGLGAAARHRVRHRRCRGEARAPGRGWGWPWAALRPPDTVFYTLTRTHLYVDGVAPCVMRGRVRR